MNDDGVPRLAWAMWKRFALAGLVIVLLSAAASATAALLEVKQLAQDLGGHRLKGIGLAPAPPGAPQTFLLIGSDSRVADRRQGLRGNSDTMILVRLDPDKQGVAVLSIPRDLKAEIPHPNGVVETAKINAAYPQGGPRLTVKTIQRNLPGIKINHVINVNFKGFKQAVNYVHCVYADIDRRYFNDNAIAYATINVKPGYQRMCGSQALDYVRFRHEDTDLVRAARQQDFLTQAKEQVGVQKVISDRHAFARIFGKYTETDIHGTDQVLGLLKLAAFSIGRPVREVHFRTNLGPSFVTSTPKQIRETVREFLRGQSSSGPRGTLKSTAAERLAGRKRKKLPTVGSLSLENAKQQGEDQAIQAQPKLRFPVLYPRLRTIGSVYSDVPRVYHLPDLDHKPHEAYRMVIKKGDIGEYYGVQGMTWLHPPILDGADQTRRLGARKFDLFFNGKRLRLVALRTPRAIYWVSNTLLLSLTNPQMLAIAKSLQPVGR